MSEQITIKFSDEDLKKMFCKYFNLKRVDFYYIRNFFRNEGHELRGAR